MRSSSSLPSVETCVLRPMHAEMDTHASPPFLADDEPVDEVGNSSLEAFDSSPAASRSNANPISLFVHRDSSSHDDEAGNSSAVPLVVDSPTSANDMGPNSTDSMHVDTPVTPRRGYHVKSLCF
ncbi:unnamed protein product [Linum trigynum]|uniref:Uncharacterized protein n=1 Tax=Linum trigynum TaxID=586398 RepID=A0AAV2CE13_9ROSI